MSDSVTPTPTPTPVPATPVSPASSTGTTSSFTTTVENDVTKGATYVETEAAAVAGGSVWTKLAIGGVVVVVAALAVLHFVTHLF